MLTTLAYYKLLKSLPEASEGISSTSPLVLLAAACSNIGKDGADDELCSQARQLLASSEFLKQQQSLLESSIPNSHELLASHELLQSQEMDARKLQALEQARDLTQSRALSELSRDLAQLRKEAEKTIDAIEHGSDVSPKDSSGNSTANITIDIESHIKSEPKSPSSPSSSKPSFRPPTRTSPKEKSPRHSPSSSSWTTKPDTSSNSTSASSTVHWGANNESGPPPNKVCPISIGSPVTLHPCDSSILNSLSMIPSSKGPASIESRLHKYCLKQGPETSTSSSTISLTSGLTSTAWPQIKHEGSYNAYRRSYNCYWLSPVGPCNRQFPGKEDLYKHLRSHVNEIEALTPATAALQPLTTGCGSCEKNPRSFHSKIYSRHQPYSKCNQCTRCNCRK